MPAALKAFSSENSIYAPGSQGAPARGQARVPRGAEARALPLGVDAGATRAEARGHSTLHACSRKQHGTSCAARLSGPVIITTLIERGNCVSFHNDIYHSDLIRRGKQGSALPRPGHAHSLPCRGMRAVHPEHRQLLGRQEHRPAHQRCRQEPAAARQSSRAPAAWPRV